MAGGGSVRLRITAAALLVAGVALGGAAAALLGLLHRSLVDGVDAQARLRLTDIVALVQHGEAPATLAGEDDGTVAQIMRGDAVVSQSPLVHTTGPLAPIVPTGDAIVIRTVERAPVGDVGPYRVAARTVATPDGEVTVYAAASLEPATDAVQTLGALLAVVLPLLTVLVGAATWRLVGRTLEPVEAIRREVSEISGLSPGRRVPEPATGDEIARLARTMNEMLERLDAAAAQQRAFVSDASHELRSPLTTIRTRLEVGLSGGAGVDWPSVARSVLTEQGRLERLVGALLLLARTDEPAPAARRVPVDLDELVLREAADVQARGAVRVDVAAVTGGRVTGDRERLRRMVGNLLDNAERHAAGSVRCALSSVDGTVELVVSDDGPGVPPADRSRIFERFVRLDDARTRATGGAGLGLAIVRDTVLAHGGTVAAADAAEGARFVVRLPAAQDDPGPGMVTGKAVSDTATGFIANSTGVDINVEDSPCWDTENLPR